MSFFSDETESETETKTRTRPDVADLFEPRVSQLPATVGPAPTSPEFQMVIEMARGRSRDENALVATAKRIGERLGARAIYSFPMGKGRLEGATVHLIEALAQAYGSLLYGTRIESVDGDRVTIQGMCIDAINGIVAVRPAIFTLSPAPAKFADKADQVSRWESMQVQNAISKATRGVLQHALPKWYIDVAYEAADTVRTRGMKLKEGQTLQDVIRDACAHFATTFQIPPEGLEFYVGSKRALWTISDVLTLREAAASLKSGTLAPAAFTPPTTEAPKPQSAAVSAIRAAAEPAEAAPAASAPKLTANQAKTIAAGAALGLAREALEAKVGRPAHDWSREDLLSLSSHLATLRAVVAPVDDEDGA